MGYDIFRDLSVLIIGSVIGVQLGIFFERAIRRILGYVRCYGCLIPEQEFFPPVGEGDSPGYRRTVRPFHYPFDIIVGEIDNRPEFPVT